MELKITDTKTDEAVAVDAAEYIQRTQLGPADENEATFMSIIFAPLARIFIALYAFYTSVLFYYRQATYFFERQFLYADRTPQLIRQDVVNLSKVPRHIAFVLDISLAGGLEGLIAQSIDASSWCLGVGTPQVTIYERTGALKSVSLDSLNEAVTTGLARFFKTPVDVPVISFRSGKDVVTRAGTGSSDSATPALTITLASEQDGRPMLVSLAQEYSAAISEGKLQKSDITVDRIHEELRTRVGDEPDLLVTFGSHLDFAGFSPWLLRITELFCLPDNNNNFHYLVFYKALEKFSGVKVNLGS